MSELFNQSNEIQSFKELVGKNLLGFAVVNILCYLKETGVYDQLISGGVSVDEEASYRYGLEKMKAGNLGLLFAVGILDKSGGGEKYILPEKTIINEENIKQALKLRETFKHLDEELALIGNIPEEISFGLAVPILSLLHQKAEAGIAVEDELINSVNNMLNDDLTGIREVLVELNLVEENSLNRVAASLLSHRVIGSFRLLENSYAPLINHLSLAYENSDSLVYGGQFARDEDENAKASNRLIANTVDRLKVYLENSDKKRLLDLGSGGGFFTFNMNIETILFDRSEKANDCAVEVFSTKKDLLKGVIQGSITSKEDLSKALEYKPDVATINYIIHDILGQADSYEEGLEVVKEFLTNYKEIFGDTPLLITESWNVSWEDLREGEKPYITLYTWLHSISPQCLISPEVLKEILDELGFKIQDRITNGTMKINGELAPINETWVVVAN